MCSSDLDFLQRHHHETRQRNPRSRGEALNPQPEVPKEDAEKQQRDERDEDKHAQQHHAVAIGGQHYGLVQHDLFQK